MLKILQARLQQYVNRVHPDVQAVFRKGRGTKDQIANIHWIIKKAKESQENIYFCFIDYAKAFDCVDHNKLENSSRSGNTRPPYMPPEKICMKVKKQQLELDLEQQIGSKSGKEYVKVLDVRILSPCLFNLYAEYIMRNTGWDEAQAGIKIPPLWQKAKRN